MITELTANEWERVLAKHHDTNFFYDSNWLTLVTKCFHLKNHFLKVTIGAYDYYLMVQEKDGLGFCPFMGYITIVSTSSIVSLSTVTTIRLLAEQHLNISVTRMMLHPKQQFTGHLSDFICQKNACIELKDSIEQQMQMAQKQTRNSLQYALKHGVSVKPIPQQDLGLFYNLYLETMKRVHSDYETPLQLFEGLFSMNNVLILGAYINGRLLAVGVYLIKKPGMYYWWNCSNEAGLKNCCNYALIYKSLSRAIAMQCTFYDMSTSHTPAIELPKLKWGAQREPFFTFKAPIPVV